MDNRIEPDFSISVNMGEDSVLINRIYDNVHVFDWLGHGILKIVSEQGFLQWHTTQASALEVANAAGITPVYRPEITPTEYEQYLKFGEQMLSDDWLS
jgi:hypothetical protein